MKININIVFFIAAIAYTIVYVFLLITIIKKLANKEKVHVFLYVLLAILTAIAVSWLTIVERIIPIETIETISYP